MKIETWKKERCLLQSVGKYEKYGHNSLMIGLKSNYFEEIIKFLGGIWNTDYNSQGIVKVVFYYILPISALKA